MDIPSDSFVSLTAFERFCNTDPRGQFVVARNAHQMYMQDYDPRIDHWKRFRDTAVRAHAQPAERVRLFDKLGNELPDNKRSSYPKAIAGYKKWWGRKDITIIERPTAVLWGPHLTKIRVNPELVLAVNGDPFVVKLYFSKGENSMNRRNADLITHLLDTTHGELGTPLVIDVKKGQPFEGRNTKEDVQMALTAQSAAFSSFWKALEQGRAVA